jgi:hypothetical protein
MREEFSKNLRGAFSVDTKWMGKMMFKTKIKDLLLSLCTIYHGFCLDPWMIYDESLIFI